MMWTSVYVFVFLLLAVCPVDATEGTTFALSKPSFHNPGILASHADSSSSYSRYNKATIDSPREFVSIRRMNIPSIGKRWSTRRRAEETSTRQHSQNSGFRHDAVRLAAASTAVMDPDAVQHHTNNEHMTRRGFLRGLFRSKSEKPPASSETPADVAMTEEEEPAFSLQERLKAISKPWIPQSIWDDLTGDEWMEDTDGTYLKTLAQNGAGVAMKDEGNANGVVWKPHSSSNDDIQVWTGQPLYRDAPQLGEDIPMIKTRSIVPLSAQEMVRLLMDSSRVKTYNPWSLGRTDCWVSEDSDGTSTKIVKNKTQPPLGAKPMVAVTLLHARRWPSADSEDWMVVSRAIGGTKFWDAADLESSVGRSDVLLGVNYMKPMDEHSCELTAVTHVYSKAVPLMLVERLGVKSAIKFVNDMKRLGESQEGAVTAE